jgi:pimeloyl-ACP methyl ester carboxylesterase
MTALQRRLFSLLLLALTLTPLAAGAQADYDREQRWADEITPAILVGDPVYLQLAGGRRFLAIYAPVAKAKAGVIVVHGLGVHPDWGLINPLRTQLAAAGYSTLSVQMPVLAAGAKAEEYPAVFPDASARLRAAVAFLRAAGLEKVAIVSHSMGSRMVNHFLVHDAQPAVNAWVSIGIPDGRFADAAKLRLPVLDIYGEKDLVPVLRGASQRAGDIKLLRGSAQIEVADADHFFDGREKELVAHVRMFLDRALK